MTDSNMPVDEFALSEVRYLVSQGKKIDAIAKYREIARVGLAEAKAAIESLSAGGKPPMQPSMNPIADDIVQKAKALMQQGNKIEAIKIYRDATGTGLKEAKDAVESLAAAGLSTRPDQPLLPGGGSREKIETLLQQGNIIEAIKMYREATGTGLKEAKDAIDAIRRERGW